MRAITEHEYKQLKQDNPWDKSRSFYSWMQSLGAERRSVNGRIVTGGKVHSLHAWVVTLNGEPDVVIDAEQYCGSGRRGFQYYFRLDERGPRCGKCFKE